MKKRLFATVSIIFLFALLSAGCGGKSDAGDGAIVLKVGHIAPEEHSYAKGFNQFAEAVEKETGGKVKFEIYGNGQLGGEREIIEQVQLGSLDMTVVTAGPVGNFVEEFSVLEMPFLFRDLDHVYKTLDGEIGQELMGELEKAGFKALGIWENGMRHLTNNKKPIRSPEDLKGMKMRTVENDVYVETYRALGADPTPIAFPEVYTSLQQRVVDGLDSSYGVFHSTKLYEVQNHLSEVGIYYAAAPLLMNKDKFESLPEDVQRVLVEKGREFAEVQRQINQEMEKEQKEDFIKKGGKVVEAEDLDLEAFRKAVQPVYEKYRDRFGDMVERIEAVK